MRIEFDSAKDASNLEKHGLSLALAVELDWDAALVWVDERYDYGELRIEAALDGLAFADSKLPNGSEPYCS